MVLSFYVHQMEKRLVVVLLLFATLGLLCSHSSAGQVHHCVYGITVKDLLKLAGINGANLLSYVTKLRAHNVDQTVLPSLTLQQLNDIGISALGDRVKIYNFFSRLQRLHKLKLSKQRYLSGWFSLLFLRLRS